jgi:hypothetical protein
MGCRAPVGHCGAVGALDWAERRQQRLSTVARRGGGGPVRGFSSGKEMLWKRRAATSKQDHRAAVRRVLRPGVMLWVLAGAGNDGEGVAAGGRLGNSWHARGRAAGEGNRAGAGGERRVDVIPAGGGAAAARGEALPATEGGTEQRSTCSRKKKRGEGSGGPVWKSQELQGPLSKLKFPTDVGVK